MKRGYTMRFNTANKTYTAVEIQSTQSFVADLVLQNVTNQTSRLVQLFFDDGQWYAMGTDEVYTIHPNTTGNKKYGFTRNKNSSEISYLYVPQEIEPYVTYHEGLTYAAENITSLDPYNTGGGGGVPEAPSDGKQYARQDRSWKEVDVDADQYYDYEVTCTDAALGQITVDGYLKCQYHPTVESAIYLKNGGNTYTTIIWNYIKGAVGSYTEGFGYYNTPISSETRILIVEAVATTNVGNPDIIRIPKKYIDSGEVEFVRQSYTYPASDIEEATNIAHIPGGGGDVVSVNGMIGQVVLDGTNMPAGRIGQSETVMQAFTEINDKLNAIEEMTEGVAHKIPTEDVHITRWSSIPDNGDFATGTFAVGNYQGSNVTGATQTLQNIGLFEFKETWSDHPSYTGLILIHFDATYDSSIFGDYGTTGSAFTANTPQDNLTDKGAYWIWYSSSDNKFGIMYAYGTGGPITPGSSYQLPDVAMVQTEMYLSRSISEFFTSSATTFDNVGRGIDLIDTIISRPEQIRSNFTAGLNTGNVGDYRPIGLFTGDQVAYSQEYTIQRPVYLYSIDKDFHFKFNTDGTIDCVFDDEIVATLSQPGKVYECIGFSAFDFNGYVGDQADIDIISSIAEPVLEVTGKPKVLSTNEVLTVLSDAQNRDRKTVQIKDRDRYTSFKQVLPLRYQEIWQVNNPQYSDLPNAGSGVLNLKAWLAPNVGVYHTADTISNGSYLSVNTGPWIQLTPGTIGTVTGIQGVYNTNPKTKYPMDDNGLILIPEPQVGQTFNNRQPDVFNQSTDTLTRLYFISNNTNIVYDSSVKLTFAKMDNDPNARHIQIDYAVLNRIITITVTDTDSGQVLYTHDGTQSSGVYFTVEDDTFMPGVLLNCAGSAYIYTYNVWSVEFPRWTAQWNALYFSRDSIPGVVFKETLNSYLTRSETKEDTEAGTFQTYEYNTANDTDWENYGSIQRYNPFSKRVIDYYEGGDFISYVDDRIIAPYTNQPGDSIVNRVRFETQDDDYGYGLRKDGRLVLLNQGASKFYDCEVPGALISVYQLKEIVNQSSTYEEFVDNVNNLR